MCRSGVTGMCHDLAGTDGTQYPPFVPKVFSESVCPFVSMNVWFSSISNSHKKRISFTKCVIDAYFSLGLAKVRRA